MIHVLVVDDERDFADLLAQRLQARGLDVRAVYSGQAALEAVREQSPEVVILDINMPGMTGLQALEAIKAEAPLTEVILLTADSTVGTAVAGMKLGAGDYLIKPASIDTVLASIGESESRRLSRMSRRRMAETAKLAALGVMGTGVAHEINNPLNILVNEAGLIEDLLEDVSMSGDTEQEIRASLAQIIKQTRRCKAITAKLLTLRPAPARQKAEETLPDLTRNLLTAQQDRMTKWGIRAETLWDSRLEALSIRQSEWEEVLGNLIDNAVLAMEDWGGRLKVSGQVEDDELVLAVSDTGCGMEKHVMARIFEPFFSTREVGRGIGLGLAICHGMVEAMGGTITVRSTPGHGSVFTIKAPMSVHGRIEHTASDGSDARQGGLE